MSAGDKENFLMRYLIGPMNNTLYGFRQVAKKIGYLQAWDELLLRSLEEPLGYRLLERNYQFQVQGAHNLPQEEGAILVSNLQSFFDPIIAGIAVMHHCHCIPKHILPLSMGIDSLWMNITRMNQAIFLRGPEVEEEVVEECQIELTQRKHLIVYPEMKIAEGRGNLLPFSGEFVRLAFYTKAPLVPMAIYGSERIYSPKIKMPQLKGNVKVRFGKPIPFEKAFGGVQDLQFRHVERMTSRLQRKVKALWSHIWAEEEEKRVGRAGTID